MNKHQITTLVVAAILIATIGTVVFAMLNRPAGAQFSAMAKGDYLGVRQERVCQLAEREAVSAIFHHNDNANVSYYDAHQARQYSHFLQNGWKSVQIRNYIYGIEGEQLPIADRLYIVEYPSQPYVWHIFVVDGCAVKTLTQTSKMFHTAILNQMRGVDA
jgi:hypothetical protein